MMSLACAADANYIPHAAAMLHSAFTRGGPGLEAHLLHPADTDPVLLRSLADWAAGVGPLHLHPIDESRVADLPEMGRISRVMWYRLFLPELLSGARRVLYVDCDVIVRAPLAPLFDTDLGGRPLGAVHNVFERMHAHHAAGLGLTADSYFNSGVLLLDLDAWRRERHADAILRRVRDGQRLLFPDQDALNLVFAGRWQPLHPRWNCQNSFFIFDDAPGIIGAAALASATREPGIVHFEGGELSKPWHYLCKNPFRDDYFRHRAATPWPRQPLQGRTWLNRLLRILPARQLIPALRWVRRVDPRRARARR